MLHIITRHILSHATYCHMLSHVTYYFVHSDSFFPVIFTDFFRCQKSLNEFLEEKRSAFPRFYFIGDDDLLEILGQSKNPYVIQSHLKKLFAGIYSVKFNKEMV